MGWAREHVVCVCWIHLQEAPCTLDMLLVTAPYASWCIKPAWCGADRQARWFMLIFLLSMHLLACTLKTLDQQRSRAANLANAPIGFVTASDEVITCTLAVSSCRLYKRAMHVQALATEQAKQLRDAQSRSALQQAQLREQLEAESKAAQAAAIKAEQEARAHAAQERLDALRAKWAEETANAQVVIMTVHMYAGWGRRAREASSQPIDACVHIQP